MEHSASWWRCVELRHSDRHAVVTEANDVFVAGTELLQSLEAVL